MFSKKIRENNELIESYELPIKLQNSFTAYLFDALPLCVLLTDEHNYSWYYENFIEIYHLYEGINVNCIGFVNQDLFFMGLYKNVFKTIVFDDLINKYNTENFMEIIKNQIKNGYYLYILLDEFFLPNKKAFHKQHYSHDSLIYGFDNKANSFLAVSYDANEKFTKLMYHYDDFASAFTNNWNVRKLENLQIVFFKNNSYINKHEFSLDRFLSKLDNYIWANSTNEYHFSNGIYTYGTQIHEELANRIYDRNNYIMTDMIHQINFDDFRSIHFIYQHKIGLYERFKYIYNNFHFNDSLLYKTIEEYNTIVINETKVIRSISLKVRMIFDNYNQIINLRNKIRTKLVDVMQNEKNILIKIYELFKNYPCQNLFCPPNIINKNSCQVVYKDNINDDFIYSLHKKISITFISAVYLEKLIFENLEFAKIEFSNGYVTYINSPKKFCAVKKELKFTLCPLIDWIEIEYYSYYDNDLLVSAYETDLARNKKVIASSSWEENGAIHPDYIPSRIVDGYDNTFWTSKYNPKENEYIQIDLEISITFNCIILLQRFDADRISGYKIYYSQDNYEWSLLYYYNKGLIGNSPIIHYFKSITCRYLKIEFTSTIADSNGYTEPGITYLKIYNYTDINELISQRYLTLINCEE